MPQLALDCSIRFENEEDAESGALILRLRPSPECENETDGSVADRLARAADWALELDAQYQKLIRAGGSPQVTVPAGRRIVAGRVERETPSNYRKLQLSVGALIRPLLLDTPKLEQLYPFQHQGVEWLINRSGGILADDMGLGKTVQLISAKRQLFNRAKLRTA
ncbi:MAG: hypothetical protein F4Y91_14770 [Gemmatimonadetes bacterium]|nr:hypothetical protein [Gemmatimonadota bacterium]